MKGSEVKNSKGHYSAKCHYCSKFFDVGYPWKLEKHLAKECGGCNREIRKYYLDVIAKKQTKTVKKKESNQISSNKQEQLSLSEFYESTTLTTERNDNINRALIRAFVMCGIPFNIIQNPYFIELLRQLRPAYTPPNRKAISGRLLDAEVTNINTKINLQLENQKNLTLGKDFYYAGDFYFNILNLVINLIIN